jgi:hypothetical protein
VWEMETKYRKFNVMRTHLGMENWLDGFEFTAIVQSIIHAGGKPSRTVCTTSLARLVGALNNATEVLKALIAAAFVVAGWMAGAVRTGHKSSHRLMLLWFSLLLLASQTFQSLISHGRLTDAWPIYTENIQPNAAGVGPLDFNFPLEDTPLADLALANFEIFHGLMAGTATIQDLHGTSAGLLVWAEANLSPEILHETAPAAGLWQPYAEDIPCNANDVEPFVFNVVPDDTSLAAVDVSKCLTIVR